MNIVPHNNNQLNTGDTILRFILSTQTAAIKNSIAIVYLNITNSAINNLIFSQW